MMLHWFRRQPAHHQRADGSYRHGNTCLLELRAVHKQYRTAAGLFSALRGIDLQVDRGEFVAVLGKSGSGKSTLMNMIAGIDRPTSGEVLVGDTAVHTLDEGQMAIWRGTHIGVIFQSFLLLPNLTVIENVMLPMDVCNTVPANQFRERALHLLDQVEMARHADKLPATISGGEQQRVAIARALANDPAIILADEPTGNLDTRTGRTIMDVLQRFNREHGQTILMVTHDESLAGEVSRSRHIKDGRLVE
jgi:putative ABC transport system ATP-binding protein